MPAKSAPQPVHFLGLAPRFLGGVLEIPVYHMRGGTSTGIVLYEGKSVV